MPPQPMRCAIIAVLYTVLACLILHSMSRPRIYYWLSGLALLCCVPGFAATVYKSIDEKGVVTFSDSKPPDETLVEILEIGHSQPVDSEAAEQRLQDMRETTDRMVADRMAREKHRAEIRQLDAQTEASQSPRDLTDYYDTSTIYTGYYPYPVRRPWRPLYRPHPEQPIAHPPLSPPRPNLPPGVRPLPGNEYPASLIRKSYNPKVRAALR